MVVGGIAIAFIVGLYCGYGIDRLIGKSDNDLTYAEYEIIVQKINNDDCLSAGTKKRYLNMLHSYVNGHLQLDLMDRTLVAIVDKVKRF